MISAALMDAQDKLLVFNALDGTSFTLACIIEMSSA